MLPILLSIGNIHIATSSIIQTFGFLVSLYYLWKKLRIEIIEEEKIFDFVLVFVLSALFFGRIFYVLEHYQDFNLWIDRIIHIYKYPGFNIWGIFLGGMFGAFFYLIKFFKLKVYFFDILSLSLSLFLTSLFLGFFTDGVYIGQNINNIGLVFIGYAGKRFPLQLVGAMLFIGFFLLFNQVNIKKYPGFVFWFFLTYFFVIFFVLEFVRGDRIYFEGILINKFLFFLASLFSCSIFFIKYKNVILNFLLKKLVKNHK